MGRDYVNTMTKEWFNEIREKIIKMYESLDYDEIYEQINKLGEQAGVCLNGMLVLHFLNDYLDKYNFNLVMMTTALKQFLGTKEEEQKKTRKNKKVVNTDNFSLDDYQKHEKDLSKVELDALNEVRGLTYEELVAWEQFHKDEIEEHERAVEVNTQILNTKYNEDGIFELIGNK